MPASSMALKSASTSPTAKQQVGDRPEQPAIRGRGACRDTTRGEYPTRSLAGNPPSASAPARAGAWAARRVRAPRIGTGRTPWQAILRIFARLAVGLSNSPGAVSRDSSASIEPKPSNLILSCYPMSTRTTTRSARGGTHTVGGRDMCASPTTDRNQQRTHRICAQRDAPTGAPRCGSSMGPAMPLAPSVILVPNDCF